MNALYSVYVGFWLACSASVSLTVPTAVSAIAQEGNWIGSTVRVITSYILDGRARERFEVTSETFADVSVLDT